METKCAVIFFELIYNLTKMIKPIMTTYVQDTHKLLLLCSNPFCRIDQAVPLLDKNINWDEFTDLAHQHRLLPVIHRLATEWPHSVIPP